MWKLERSTLLTYQSLKSSAVVQSDVLPLTRRDYNAPNTLSVKLSDFTVWRHTWRKNCVNCAVLTGNSAGLRTVLSSRLSHREMRSSLKESHSFLSLPADNTMASSQGTSISSNSFRRWTSHDILLFKYHFLLHIFFFSWRYNPHWGLYFTAL